MTSDDEGPTINMPSEGDSGDAGNGDSGGAGGREDFQTADLPPGPSQQPTVRLNLGEEIDEPLDGKEIGPYRVRGILGEGGFGVVYLADQVEPVRRRVALKVIKPGMDSRAVVARFEAERQALAVMDHPCIARVFDAGQTPKGRPYFVMEYVKGVPLTDFVSKQRMDLESKLKLFQRVCEAVQHAHTKGIIHRDLKPSNILVEYEDGHATPKIIDFGVAKAVDQRLTEKTIFTEQGQILGTPEYMSPEQAEMSGLDIDTRTDIYALGVVLYELLTGQLPFDPQSLRSAGYAEIQRIIREVDPPKPSTKLSTVGGARGAASAGVAVREYDSKDLTKRLRRDLDWVVMKCLEKNRERRYPTATSLSAEIGRYLKFEPVEAGPPSVGYRLAKLARRRRGVLTSAALVFLALVVGVVGLGIGLSREAAAREREAEARVEAETRAEEASQLAGFTTDILTGIDPDVASRYDTDLLRVIFDDASKRVGATDDLRPEVEGSIRAALGRAYVSITSTDEAKGELTRAIDLLTQTRGGEDPATLEARAAMAETLWDSGELDEAEAVYGELIEIAEAKGADGVASLRRLQTNLGGVLVDKGSETYERAGELMDASLAAQRKDLGESHPDTLRTMSFLSSLKQRAGEPEAAMELAQQIVEARRAALGDDDIKTIFAEQRVAELEFSLRRFEAAAERFEALIPRLERAVGDEHSSTLGAMYSLGAAYRQLRQPEQALEYLAPAATALETKFGLAHRNTFRAIYYAGSASMDLERHEDALGWFDKMLVSARTFTTSERGVYENIAIGFRGVALLGLDRLEEAEAALAEAKPRLEELLPPTAGQIRRVNEALAEVYERTDRADLAEELRAAPDPE